MLLLVSPFSKLGEDIIRNQSSRDYTTISLARSFQDEFNETYKCLYIKSYISDHPDEILAKFDYLLEKVDSLVLIQRYRTKKEESFSLNDSIATEVKVPINFCRNLSNKTNSLKSIFFCSSIVGKFVPNNQPISYHITKAEKISIIIFCY